MGSLEVLTAMITPAVLISAAALLVLSTSNRLGRVVDRVRALGRDAAALQQEASAAEVARRRAFMVRQVEMLVARMGALRTSLTALYAGIGLFVATSIAVGVLSALRVEAGWLPVALALGGSGALLYASALLVREARLAVVSTLEETTALEASIAASEGAAAGQSGLPASPDAR